MRGVPIPHKIAINLYIMQISARISKPIEENFAEDTTNYPVTGKHHDHEVRAEGAERTDADGKPYPTKNGIHGTKVAVDWETCIADGACMDVCPVSLY